MKNRKNGFSKIDVLLIVVIVACAGFVLYRVLNGRQQARAPKTAAPVATALKPTQPPPGNIGPVLMQQGAEYTDREWDAILKDPAFKNRLVKRSSGCASPQQRTEWGIPITTRDMQTRPLVGNWRTWMVHEKIRCFEVGQILHVVTFDRNSASPPIKYSGIVKVTSIAELPLEQYPQSVFDFYKVSRKEGIDYLRKHSVRTPTGLEMILRTSDIDRAVEPFVDPPHLLPSGKVITRAELGALKAADLAIFDVRSPEEFQAGSIPKAKNVPFGGSDPGAAKFNPTITNAMLSRYTFDVDSFSQHRGATIVLVGGSEKDPRPLWASMVLFDLGFSNMVWVLDGGTAAATK